MHILLMRLGPDNDWQPMTQLARALAAHEPCSVDITVAPGKLFTLNLSLPPKLLLLGAGPDAAPVVDFAARLNWKVTLVDHRPAYADASHFPAAEQVVQASPDEIPLDLSRFSAAVVMSHHLPSDLQYLRTLAATSIAYIGLLGPAVRRERLLSDLGEDAHKIRGRLHAPVGLALGGRSPESIALAIVAEIHAFVHNAPAANRTS
jgi:xanthine/CO dehydrogenase XdhC/CoxF family maturation factor